MSLVWRYGGLEGREAWRGLVRRLTIVTFSPIHDNMR